MVKELTFVVEIGLRNGRNKREIFVYNFGQLNEQLKQFLYIIIFNLVCLPMLPFIEGKSRQIQNQILDATSKIWSWKEKKA